MSTPISIPLARRRIPLSPMHRAVEKIKYPKGKNVQVLSSKDPHSVEVPKGSPFELKAPRCDNGTSRFGKDIVCVSDGSGGSVHREVQEDDYDPTHSIG